MSPPPIFVVGTGRCGSTIVYSMLAMHPELAWIPSWMNVLPTMPIVSAINRLWGIPGTDRPVVLRKECVVDDLPELVVRQPRRVVAEVASTVDVTARTRAE